MTRAEAIEAAARALIEYQDTGGPDFNDWDALFDALRAALSASARGAGT